MHSEPQHLAATSYTRTLADQLGLKDWMIKVKQNEHCDAKNNAEIDCTDGRRQATIRLAEDFFTNDPTDQRDTLVHELLHCHHDAASKVILEDLPDLLGRPMAWAVESGYRRAMELGIDTLAVAIAGFFPLPDFPAE